MDVLLEKIKLADHMMRQKVGDKKMEDLVKSIKRLGIINPIVVRKKGDQYEIVAGFRRFMAAKLAELEKVPVKVIRKDDEIADLITIDENIIREDVDPIDEGEYFSVMIEKHKLTQKALAATTGLSESYISQRMSACNWPEILRNAVKNEEVNFSVAREFAGVKDYDKMVMLLETAIRSGVTPAVASRWKHEANRVGLGEGEGEGTGALGEGTGYGSIPPMTCQICGGEFGKGGDRNIRSCESCCGIIKIAQEQGAFKAVE